MCHYVQKTEDLPIPEKSLKEIEKGNMKLETKSIE